MHTDLQITLLNNLSSDNDSSISSSSSSASSIAPSLPSNSTSEPAISNITQTLNDLNFSNNKNTVVNDMFDNIFEQITLGIYFDIYKSFQMNSIKVSDNTQFTNDMKNSEPQNKKCDKSGIDIFGHSLNGIKKLECICPNCSRTLAASRLAPHLEKCMGMGRNSSRLASKRIALFIKNSNGASSE